MYSPKLDKALKECSEILKRHDLAGLIVLHNPGGIRSLLKVDPSYSCCRETADKITVSARRSDFKTQQEFESTLLGTHQMMKMISDTAIDLTYPYYVRAEELEAKLEQMGIKPPF